VFRSGRETTTCFQCCKTSCMACSYSPHRVHYGTYIQKPSTALTATLLKLVLQHYTKFQPNGSNLVIPSSKCTITTHYQFCLTLQNLEVDFRIHKLAQIIIILNCRNKEFNVPPWFCYNSHVFSKNSEDHSRPVYIRPDTNS